LFKITHKLWTEELTMKVLVDAESRSIE